MPGKKIYLSFILIIFLIIIVLPVLIIQGNLWPGKKSNVILKVYNHREQKVVKMELNEYLRGVLAGEMPALYHLEALKAQAVAARTYTLKQLPAYGGPGCKEYPGADISTDYRYSQAWLSEDDMKKKWGFLSFFYYWAKINRAVEETRDEIMVYNGEIIDAVYHANSGGRTEDAVSVWGRLTPYLKSVDSPYDSEKENSYYNEYYFALNDIANKLNIKYSDTCRQLKILKRSNGGTVLEVKVGNQVYTGKEIRNKLSLPSANFKIKLEGDIITISTLGKGHGAGMSQDGANGMAKAGYNYQQVLKHYYQGIEIKTIN